MAASRRHGGRAKSKKVSFMPNAKVTMGGTGHWPVPLADFACSTSAFGINPNAEVETALWAERRRWSATFTPQKAWLE
ncbi:MAG: hypothetical protein EB141_06965 [Verrucomicrobia bacterium]|nr:hypothetical protein [Pseudomonadota bacterium]NDB75373.1 hypothetical protein [Verrucomicrobiota bacterium]